MFSNQLQISLTFLGYDTKFYQSHSFRIGAAIWAKSRDVSEGQIQLCGRWKSEMVFEFRQGQSKILWFIF
jgi:hypothetical protein